VSLAAGPRTTGLPLEGLLVVGIEQAVAAPLATRHLADLGARVIKIENPRGGDFARDYDAAVKGLAAHFVWCNRGKESLTLDFRSEAGMAVMRGLLERADVLIQNLAPGAAARRGLAAEQVTARYPRLIAVDITGYGDGGPLQQRRAYDLLVQSEAASCSVTGEPGAPAKPGIPVADVGAGMYAYSSVLAAIYDREHTGRGTAISVALFDAVAEWMGYPLQYTLGTGIEQLPRGVGSPAVAPYGSYPTADGQQIVLGTTNDGEWQRLAAAIDRPDLARDPAYARNAQRVEQRAHLDPAIAAWTVQRTFSEVQDAMDAATIGHARLNGVQDLIDHPQLTERKRWSRAGSPVGDLDVLLPPPVSPRWRLQPGAVPGLGEHTDAVLGWLGYAPADVARLHADGVV
jgi:crotonobetainyl-CoA:carnitine CoA-transferase CaiB-like acyl-CoA transferase